MKPPLAGGCAGAESLFPSQGGWARDLLPTPFVVRVGRAGGRDFLVAPFREGPLIVSHRSTPPQHSPVFKTPRSSIGEGPWRDGGRTSLRERRDGSASRNLSALPCIPTGSSTYPGGTVFRAWALKEKCPNSRQKLPRLYYIVGLLAVPPSPSSRSEKRGRGRKS